MGALLSWAGGSSAALNWRNDPDSANCRRGGSIPYSSDFVDPPYEQTLPLALRVADLLTDAAPSPGCSIGSQRRPEQRLVFDDTTRRGLWRLFRDGEPRSWRFLEVTGVLADALPEMSEALDRRRHDATQLDPAGNLRWPLVERLVQPDDDTRLAAEYKRLDHPERVLLAALALDATDQGVDASSIAMGLCARLGVSPDGDAAISDLVSKPELLRAAAARPTQLGQNHVLQLASHLGSEESARASYVLGVGHYSDWRHGRALEVEELLHVEHLLRRHLLPAVRRHDLGWRLARSAR